MSFEVGWFQKKLGQFYCIARDWNATYKDIKTGLISQAEHESYEYKHTLINFVPWGKLNLFLERMFLYSKPKLTRQYRSNIQC